MEEKLRSGEGDSRAVAVALTGIALGAQTWFLGWAVVGLDVAMVFSFLLWVARPVQPEPRRVLPVLAVACLVQAAHLTEEYRAGFQRAFPALFGYVWEDWRFLAFNFAWLALFGASAVAIARRYRLGTLPALFLALGGGIANGVAHLILAIRAGGYFPGAYTAPLCLAAGILLLMRLLESREILGSLCARVPESEPSRART